MKAMLIILIIMNNSHGNKLTTIEVPMSTYEHCTGVADATGESIAVSLGDKAYSVSTECVNQRE